MNYKLYTIDEIKKRFIKVTKKYEIVEAYLFGSYARGDATKYSDIDFYIKTGKLKSGWDIGGIWHETEKTMKKKIHIIYAGAKLDIEFEEEMKKEWIKIYG